MADGEILRLMSEKNIEIARRMLDAFNAHDVEALVELTSPDCLIVAQRSGIEGEFRGHDGVRRWAEGYFEIAPDARVVTKRVLAADGDRVVVLGRQMGTASMGGAPIDAPLAGVAELEAGLVKSLRAYPSHAEALDAAGLPK